MTAAELIAIYRRKSGDSVEAYQWEDSMIIDVLNEAVDEAATRADLIFDSSFTVAVEINTATYPLDSSVVNISKAYLVDSGLKQWNLGITDREAMDDADPNWREDESGLPLFLIVSDTSMQIHPPPSATYTLHLEAYRVPLVGEKIATTDHSPVIASQHHRHLVDWVLYQATSDEDSDAYDARKAAGYEAQFDAYFGPPVTYDRNRKERTNTPHRTKTW